MKSTKIVLLIFLLALLVWMSKKAKDELEKSGNLENLGPPFSWPGESHPAPFTIARVASNIRNIFTVQWWRGLWSAAAYGVHSDPEANRIIIENWIAAGQTAERVLFDKVQPGYFSVVEGYQYLDRVYAPAFMDYRMNQAAEYAANQLNIYAANCWSI